MTRHARGLPGHWRRPTVGAAAFVLMCATLLAAAACSGADDWQNQTLNEAFPELAFELTGSDGEVFTESSLHGKVTLLFFGFTSCPDACPMTMSTLRAALDALPEAQRSDVRVLFVSVDPERDDPPRLAAYTQHFGAQFIGATADIERLRSLTHRYGTTFRHDARGEDGHYLVAHGANVLAFGRDGRARLLIAPDSSAEAIAHDLGKLVAS